MQAPTIISDYNTTGNHLSNMIVMDFADPTMGTAASKPAAHVIVVDTGANVCVPMVPSSNKPHYHHHGHFYYYPLDGLLYCNTLVAFFSIPAIACLAVLLQGQWEGASTVFALFTTVSAIIFFTFFATARVFMLRTELFHNNTAAVKGFLFANMAYCFVYFVFFMATASDWLRKVLQMNKFNRFFGAAFDPYFSSFGASYSNDMLSVSTAEGIAFVTIAYLCAFVCLVSMVLLGIHIRRAFRANRNMSQSVRE